MTTSTSNELDIRIVIDDTTTIIGCATFDLQGNVTIEQPAFMIPDEHGRVQFIPTLPSMGISEEETTLEIAKSSLKFGKAFKADAQIAQLYKQSMGITVIEVPATKQLILD